MSDGRQQGQCEETRRGKAQNGSCVQWAPREMSGKDEKGVCV